MKSKLIDRYACVYRIFNTETNTSYVGSTINPPPRRWAEHYKRLTTGTHNYEFQKDWDIFGCANFAFQILESQILENDRFEKEQYWFERFDCKYNATAKIIKIVKMQESIDECLELLKTNTIRDTAKAIGKSIGWVHSIKSRYRL